MKIREYIKEKGAFLAGGILFALFPGMVMALSTEKGFWKSDGFYCMVVMSSIFVCYVGYDYWKKKKYCERLLRLLGEDGLDFIVSLPAEVTWEQIVYRALLFQLKKNAETEISEFEEKKAEDIDFIETWVHEIKTPIAAARLLIENSLDCPNEQVLYDISDEIVKIEDMVQKTICYSQLGDFQKDCQIENVNVKKVVHKCLQSEYSNIRNKHVKLDIREIDFEVISDEKWLYFIVKQILDNAVKYSRDYGQITVYGVNEKRKWKLVIQDEGIGIRQEDIRRIFEKGFTGRNGRESTVSTGVGLYLSNKLASKLGHEIDISSKIGNGTKVEIHFVP